MLQHIAISICLTANVASAEQLGGINQPQQARAARSNGAPVLSEAENASQDASSATVAPVATNRVDPNARQSDPSCQGLVSAAVAHNVPVEFFVRLIRQESNFDPYSVSHKGAQGIAQFMPGTARWRGLADPFEPQQALHESARWLGELREQFGNLGLAAAAYNAGPRRVLEWLGGRGNLPGETRAYVRIITGRSAEEWARGTVDEPLESTPKQLPCEQLINRVPVRPGITVTIRERTVGGPWGLQLIGNWSESQALSDYKALQKRFQPVLGDRPPMVIKSRMAGRGSAPWYQIRVAESTRDRAKQLCSRLESIGGSCLVFRN
jgi:Transglycosylase SLT domain